MTLTGEELQTILDMEDNAGAEPDLSRWHSIRLSRLKEIARLALVGLAVQPRPIEEAPKDGTRILALWGGEWVITYWVHDRFGYNGWQIPSGMVVKANDRSAWQPTHFIPLTSLPEPKA